MKLLKYCIAGLLCWWITSCASSPVAGGTSSLSRDEWGHRPGPQGFTTVILDAGHGGKDSGAVSPYTGQKEKDLTLDTVMRVKRQLAGKVRVELMRSDDTFVELDERVRRASMKGSAILVSIHYNSSGAGCRGPETYYWRVDSHGLATRIEKNLTAVSPMESGSRGMVRRRIRLTRNPNIPSVLVECGYLSNPAEAKLCASPAYRDQLAKAIADAILTQKKIGDLGTGPLPPPLYAPPSRPMDARE
jgi:N-acetylmuramoyl-L-alanine amidase